MIRNPVSRIAVAATLFAMLPAATARADPKSEVKSDLSVLPPVCWATVDHEAFDQSTAKRRKIIGQQVEALFASGATAQACRQLDRLRQEMKQTASILDRCARNPAIGRSTRGVTLLTTLSGILTKTAGQNGMTGQDRGC